MNKLAVLLSFALLLSCSQREKKTNVQAELITADTSNLKVTFRETSGKGILIGQNIKLLDSNLIEIKDISHLNEQFVQFLEISEQYHKHNPTDKSCEAFKYAKIKTGEMVGYIDGRHIYMPVKDLQNKKVKIGRNEVSIIVASNLGAQSADPNGLISCFKNKPVFLFDESANYEGLVKMVKNKKYKSDYPYFELQDDIKSKDEILSIEKQKGRYLIKIERIFKDGRADILVAIYKGKTGMFLAEIVEHIRMVE